MAQSAAPDLLSKSVVVIDATTGSLIFEKNSDEVIPPASLTKLMTMHLAFREIKAGRASLDEIIVPSSESWAVNQLPRSSVMYLAEGQKLTLRELFLGMAVPSGNDAAMATALRFAPTLDVFVSMMNREAEALGLKNTRFVDASGYWEHNQTTAREFAAFCRVYLNEHFESLENFHSVRELIYPRPDNWIERSPNNPGSWRHRNTNNLLGNVEGVDGIKTGYIPEAGYNIALTAERNNTRFIAVILGAASGDRIRDEDGRKILEWAFASYKTIRPEIGVMEPTRVWKGRENFVKLALSEPLVFTAPAVRGQRLTWSIELDEPFIAPIAEGTAVGNLFLYDSLGELRRIPLLTAHNTESGSFFKRLIDTIRLFFQGLKKK